MQIRSAMVIGAAHGRVAERATAFPSPAKAALFGWPEDCQAVRGRRLAFSGVPHLPFLFAMSLTPPSAAVRTIARQTQTALAQDTVCRNPRGNRVQRRSWPCECPHAVDRTVA